MLLSIEQTVSKEPGSGVHISSHRLKAEDDLDGTKSSSGCKRQKLNYDYEEDSYNDYEDEEDDSDDDDENEHGDNNANGYLMLAQNHHLGIFGEENMYNQHYSNHHQSSFMFDSGVAATTTPNGSGAFIAQNGTQGKSKNLYSSSSSASTSSESSSTNSSSTKNNNKNNNINDTKQINTALSTSCSSTSSTASLTGLTNVATSSASSSKKKKTLELKTEPIMNDLKLKAFDLNRKQEGPKQKKFTTAAKSKTSAKSVDKQSKDELDRINDSAVNLILEAVKSGTENEIKTNKRKNGNNSNSKVNQTNKSTTQKAPKTTAKKTTDVSKKTNANSKLKKTAASKTNLTHSAVSLVNPIESTLLPSR